MTILEIIFGVLMILVSAAIIIIVLSQESKGQGLSGVITGTEMMSGESRARSKEARQYRATKIAAIVFFVMIILMNIFSMLSN
ncbi:preprotein translocase subunit SecG [Ruminococcaceae bacterium OttesenSCG-928-A11]|nr:preprotein translocase subunit SecG [Ruminococcaceae bacterium OttesenSCG-928-A11]